MATIDVDSLRDHLLDYCGSAMMSGFPAAVIDVADIEHASGETICCEALILRYAGKNIGRSAMN